MQTLRERKAKFWLFIPVVVIPLVTLLFWKFGGGSAQAATTQSKSGYNLQLPEAAPANQDNWTKMDYYKKAEQDSMKRMAINKRDPAFVLSDVTEKQPEEKVYRKLKELEEQMQQEEEISRVRPARKRINYNHDAPESSHDVRKLERMMQQIQQPAEPDPEMEQLNEMLNKLTALGNPSSDRNTSITDTVDLSAVPVDIADADNIFHSQEDHQHFYGLNDKTNNDQPSIIKAIVTQQQSVINGSVVVLRLVQPIKVGESIIPKGFTIHAIAAIQQNRLLLSVKGIIYNDQLLPVQLKAIDLTGTDGIAINNKASNEFSKQALQRSVGNIGFNNLNPTVEGRIAEAGLQTAKNIFSKKTKTVYVTLRAGDELWFIDQAKRK